MFEEHNFYREMQCNAQYFKAYFWDSNRFDWKLRVCLVYLFLFSLSIKMKSKYWNMFDWTLKKMFSIKISFKEDTKLKTTILRFQFYCWKYFQWKSGVIIVMRKILSFFFYNVSYSIYDERRPSFFYLLHTKLKASPTQIGLYVTFWLFVVWVIFFFFFF